MSTINKDNLLDGLFGDSSSTFINTFDIKEISIDLIDDLYSFEHPFAKSFESEKGIAELAEQIKIYGVLQPLILRPKEGRYELLAGHRRKRASIIANLKSVPAIIRECDDDTAKLIVTHTNLGQRDEILPSEKAKAYKMEIEAIKRVAGRPKINSAPLEPNFQEYKINSSPMEPNFKSDKIIAEKVGESAAQVKRYIRLNELIEPLLDRVDDHELPFRAAVEISYLKVKEQQYLEKIISEKNIKMTIELAKELREAGEEMELTETIIDAVLNPPEEARNEQKKGFVQKPQRPVYKEVFKGLEKQLKKLPPEKAEKLALCQKEELEEIINTAINEYLDTL